MDISSILKNILTSPAGSFGFILSLFLLMFFLVYKAGKIVEKYKLLDKLAASIDKIKDDIAIIKATLQTGHPFAEAQSPINLNASGEDLASELGAREMILKNWNDIQKKIDKDLEKESNPYDIQQVCFSIGEKYSEYIAKEDFDRVKRFAFSKGFNLWQLDIVFGILIRNKYFETQGIDKNNIDLFDPQKTGKKNA